MSETSDAQRGPGPLQLRWLVFIGAVVIYVASLTMPAVAGATFHFGGLGPDTRSYSEPVIHPGGWAFIKHPLGDFPLGDVTIVLGNFVSLFAALAMWRRTRWIRTPAKVIWLVAAIGCFALAANATRAISNMMYGGHFWLAAQGIAIASALFPGPRDETDAR
jgi:hypothetical protein